MKKLQSAVLVFAASILGGCATNAVPQWINGNYYMVGDANCVTGRILSPTRISCADKRRVETGYRDAMTSEQLQMYQAQMQVQRMQMEELTQSLQQTSDSFNRIGQQFLQQSQQYVAPQVAPVAPSRTYDTRCLKAGIYVSCTSDPQ